MNTCTAESQLVSHSPIRPSLTNHYRQLLCLVVIVDGHKELTSCEGEYVWGKEHKIPHYCPKLNLPLHIVPF